MASAKAEDPDHGVELLWRAAGREHEPRPGLSLSRIVRAGIEIADAEGLAGLSMRKVAERLGFTTMSLYRHVPGRGHLVDLMRDEVLGEHPSVRRPTREEPHAEPDRRPESESEIAPAPENERATDPGNAPENEHGTDRESDLGNERRTGRECDRRNNHGTDRSNKRGNDRGSAHSNKRGNDSGDDPGGWREQLESCVRQAWEIRKRHPWLAEVRGSRHVPGPNSVAYYDHLLATMTDTGLRPSEVIAVIGLVGRFVDAEALLLVEAAQEERRSGVSEEEWWGARGSLFDHLDRYPTISALWEAGGWDQPEDPFEFGLRRLLDGIEALVDARRKPTPQTHGQPGNHEPGTPEPGDHKPGSPKARNHKTEDHEPGTQDARSPEQHNQERYETRDETQVCEECGTPITAAPSGRPRVYCSRACRQRAYRKRHAS